MADTNISSSGYTTNTSIPFIITGFNGTKCWWQDFNNSVYDQSSNPYPPVHCLSSGDQIGLLIDVEAGLLSGLAVIVALALILRNFYGHLKSDWGQEWDLIQEPADIYVLLLFFFELFQALGGITSIEWVRTGIVRTGSYCTAQGILQQIGEMGVAMSTLVIALHTFRVIWWGKSQDRRDYWIVSIVSGLVVTYDVLFVALGTGLNKDYMAPDPFWCWLGGRYMPEKIAGEYIWIWLALVASVILYPPLFFLVRGNISFEPESRFRFSFHRRRHTTATKGINPSSLKGMLLYPVIYGITVLPLSVARWTTFRLDSGRQYQTTGALAGGTFFAETVFRLSGVFNVIIILTTRRRLLFMRQVHGVGGAPSAESLDNPDLLEREVGAEHGPSVELTGRQRAERAGITGPLGERGDWNLQDGEA
ncbi:hypothetical protein OE88DRAFT_1655967 [Heliocybe sulcata]|uniref:Uncharacterized protein n=1 Tax=Heliocybe sulcata TaxID=5364 RepID=A0A5C3NA27_9AGAM|nr:hypothetical protein OE88DRAFT_1655967 [Heliocybe sulcata]